MNPRRLLALAQAAVPRATEGVVVLAYHLVGGGTRSPIDISASEFRSQLSLLLEHFDVVPLSRAPSSSDGARGRTRPRAVITFDDAFDNFRTVVWPILSRFQVPATLYVPVGFVDGSARCPLAGADLPPCSWGDLAALARDGLDIGSHTVSHPNLRKLPDAGVRRELRESRDILTDKLKRNVSSFCYPEAKYDRRTVAAVRDYYETAVAAGGRRYRSHDDPARIPRFPVRNDEDFASMIGASVWVPEAVLSLARQWRP